LAVKEDTALRIIENNVDLLRKRVRELFVVSEAMEAPTHFIVKMLRLTADDVAIALDELHRLVVKLLERVEELEEKVEELELAAKAKER